MPSDFKIDRFIPKHIKKSQIMLDKHLSTIEKYQQSIEIYKKELSPKRKFWDTLKHVLHLD